MCLLTAIELHPLTRGVTPHLGSAEHKSESAWFLSDSEAFGVGIVDFWRVRTLKLQSAELSAAMP